jgi:hypothetical protein
MNKTIVQQIDNYSLEYAGEYAGEERYHMYRKEKYDVMAIFVNKEDMENAFVLLGRQLKSLGSSIFGETAEKDG